MELIKITKQKISDHKVDAVSARDLWELLESGQQFGNWILKRIKQYGFLEGVDFISFNNSIKAENTYKTTKEYFISVNMAKELSMVERNEKGKYARLYFIECEMVAKKEIQNQIPQSFADALLLAGKLEKEKEAALLQIEEQKPLVEFAKSIEATESCISFKKMADIHFNFGRNTLMEKLRDGAVLTSNNSPYRRYIDQGLFEVDEKNINGRLISTTFITPKGQIWIMDNLRRLNI